VKHLKTFVGLVALCAALGTTAATNASNVVGQAPKIRLGADTSTNWSGYAVSGAPGSFQNVAASWTQPTVSCTSQTTYSSYWVGLDGDTTSTVEQLGTEADCVGGQPRYSAWYEMYPKGSRAIAMTVRQGDNLHASVASLGSGNFQLTLQDITTGASFTTTQKLPKAQLASAEAIVEAPWSGGVLPLANFGTANFTRVTANNATMPSQSAEQITMVNSSGAVKAQPSALSGGNFSVTWHSAT
jgi:hypothetical protein